MWTQQTPEREGNLEVIQKISPDIYLQNAADFAVHSNGKSYILDQRQSKLFELNSAGELTQTYGEQPGGGPEEFGMPSQVDIDRESGRLFVTDQGNQRMQVIDPETSEWESFILDEHSPFPFIVAHGKIYGFETNIRGPGRDYKLITERDFEGTKGKQYGELPDYGDDTMALLGIPVLFPYEDKVFSIYQHLPIIQAFDAEGELVSNIRLEHDDYISFYEENTNPETFRDADGAIQITRIFNDLQILDDRIFVTFLPGGELAAGDLMIDEFNKEGKHIQRYRKELDLEYKTKGHLRKSDDGLYYQFVGLSDDYYIYEVELR